MTTLDDRLHATAARRPDAPFLSWATGSATYGEVDEAIDRQVEAFAGAGLAGGRIALSTQNRPELVVLWLAAMRSGATLVFLNPTLTEHETVPILADLAPAATLVEADGPAADLPGVSLLPPGPGLAPTMPIASNQRPSPSVAGAGAIVLTSGSTGRPKYVPVPHQAYLLKGRANVDLLGVDPEFRTFCTMPLFHVGAQCETLATAIAAEGSVHLVDRFRASRFWEDVRGCAATHLHATSSLLHMALSGVRAPLPPANLSVIVASLRDDVAAALQVALPDVDVVTLWGLTECPLGSLSRRGDTYRTGWVGVPYVDGSVRIVSSDGRTVADGDTGEILLKNAACTPGYLAGSGERPFTEDGWLRTGDVGRLADGGLYLTGRIKEMIRRGGENIAPGEIEDVILRHPKIAEAAVVGHPDPVREEEVRAFVVPVSGARVAPAAIRDLTMQHLARFKVPRYIDIVEALPRTASNKVDKVRLAAAHPSPEWDAGAHRSRP